MTLIELAERVEQSTAPDRVLDWEIALTAYASGRKLREDQVPRFTATPMTREITAKTLREFAEVKQGIAQGQSS